MENFVFDTNTLFAFGDGQEKEVVNLIRRFGGTKVMLCHYGAEFERLSPAVGDVKAVLEAEGMPYVELVDIQPNPRSDKVYEGIELARKEGCDFFLAIGGGSAIDTAKAVAFGVPYDGDFWDFFSYKGGYVPYTLPVGSVLTIAAAGSEGSSHCVITRVEDNMKWGVIPNPVIRPKFAILNPRYTTTLPKFQIACGAFDMVSHVCERYFTNSVDVDLTDRISEAVMKTAVISAKKAVADPSDYAAQANLMWIGNLAHNETVGVGRIQDWASHLIEHELAAVVNVAHGAGLAVIMPAWMTYVKDHDPVRMAQFGVEVFGIPMNYKHPEVTADAAVAAMKQFAKDLGLPTTLGEIGVKEEDIPTIVAHRKNAQVEIIETFPFGQYVPIHEEDMTAILKLAL